MVEAGGRTRGSVSLVATVMGVVAAGLVAAGCLAIAAFARIDGRATVVWATVGGFFVVLAVGLARRWILASAAALVLGAVGVTFALLGVLAVGDAVYDRVQQGTDLTFPLLGLFAAFSLLVAGAAGVPPLGRIGRWVAVAFAVVGVAAMAAGTGWLLEQQRRPNTTPTTASATWDCGSAYSPGSQSLRPDSGCVDALDTARHGGRLALAVGLTAVLGAGAVLLGQVGWRRGWPAACLVTGVLAAGVVVWFVFLPLDGGRCSSVYDGSEGTGCASLSDAVASMTRALAVLSPLLIVAGLVGTGLAVARRVSGRSARPRARVS